MTKKEFEIQKALGLADRFLLELVVKSSCSRKEVEEAVAKYTYNSIFLNWCTNVHQINSKRSTNSYTFDIKCPFEVMAKIHTELKDRYIDSQMVLWKYRSVDLFIL